ncbi:MAG: beta-ketoacyl synthase N-terminal-like domain-containing protein [Acidobacteriota bacterium]
MTPAGVGAAAFARALGDASWRAVLGLDRTDGPVLPVAVCRDFSAREHLPPLVARRLDRPARLLAVAAREALAGSGLDADLDRERCGIAAGTWNAGTEALIEVLKTVFLGSPDEAPPAQFPSTVANAPASQVGIIEKLGGPNLTFFEKQVGGLRAAIEAARLVRDGRADAALACAVDEAHWLNAEGFERLRALARAGRAGMVLGEGATALMLASTPQAAHSAALAAWGAASEPAPPHLYPVEAGALERACRQALERSRLGPDDVDLLISAHNGLPAVERLEEVAYRSVFPTRKPAALAVTDRLGEGAIGGGTRILAAVLAMQGGFVPAWGPPGHLLREGFTALRERPRAVLVTGVAAGGSALALVLTAP